MVTFRFNKSVSNLYSCLKDKLLAETFGTLQWWIRMEENHMFEVFNNIGSIKAVAIATVANQ